MCPGYQLIGGSDMLIKTGFPPFSQKIPSLYYPMNKNASSEQRLKKPAESIGFQPA
jgi:hypothetical protein